MLVHSAVTPNYIMHFVTIVIHFQIHFEVHFRYNGVLNNLNNSYLEHKTPKGGIFFLRSIRQEPLPVLNRSRA